MHCSVVQEENMLVLPLTLMTNKLVTRATLVVGNPETLVDYSESCQEHIVADSESVFIIASIKHLTVAQTFLALILSSFLRHLGPLLATHPRCP